MTIQHITQRYGRLMELCRRMAAVSRTTIDREHYINLRHCLWARCTREIRRTVMRH